MAYCTLSPDLPLLKPDAPIMFPDGWWCLTDEGGIEGEVCVLDQQPAPALDFEPIASLDAPVG